MAAVAGLGAGNLKQELEVDSGKRVQGSAGRGVIRCFPVAILLFFSFNSVLVLGLYRLNLPPFCSFHFFCPMFALSLQEPDGRTMIRAPP